MRRLFFAAALLLCAYAHGIPLGLRIAMWSDKGPPPTPYTVRFTANGGMGSMADLACQTGVSVKLPLCNFRRDGYDFVGWSTNGANAVFADGEEVIDLTTDEDAVITLAAQWEKRVENALYVVIDISNGPNATCYPITFLDQVPEGGWTDEYKTKKIVLRHIAAGTFTMGSPDSEVGRFSDYEAQHKVTLTRPFYIGVFEITQRQWELVMGTTPSFFTNVSFYAMRPVEQVSYNDIRGSTNGAKWPLSRLVDETSFLGRLRNRTGCDKFDLPTEAQWEYACRAGATTALNSGKNLANPDIDANMAEVGRYRHNSGLGYDSSSTTANGTAIVGSYLPNEWGLYDMHGNVWEWCLDWWQMNLGSVAVTDPNGFSPGSDRVLRGGSWDYNVANCRSAYRGSSRWPSFGSYDNGMRLCLSAGGEDVGVFAPLFVEVKGYTGDYDGGGHGVSVSISTPVDGASVKYALFENGPFSTEKPLFTNVCTQTVWVEVSADNYRTQANSAVVSISPRPLAVVANAKEKTYGEADPALTYTVAGLVEGDMITGELGREAGENVGQYAIKQGTLTAGGNYAVAYTGATFTISKATLPGGTEEPGNGIVTVGGLSKFDMLAVYDGQGHTIDTNAFVVAFAEAMDGEVTVAYALDNNGSADATTWGPSPNLYTNAGEYIVWYSVSNPNYEVFSHSAKIVIAPRKLTVVAEPKTKNQGEADPELTYAVTGLLPCDELHVELEREAGEAVGTYAITLKSAAVSDNYELAFVAAALTIQVVPPRTYKVIFHSNGGNGKMTEQTIEYDKATALTRNAYTHGSHVFLGWSKTKGGAVVYNDGETVKNLAAPGGSVTLYAAWANKNYKVAFNANGGTLSNGKKMATESMTYGTSKKLSKNLFTRKGYVFIGWAKSKSGAVVYKNAQSVKNLRTDGKTTTLYAKWAKKNYKVAFYANGGKGKMAAETFTYGKAKKLTANKFTRKGYVFKGWAKSKALAKKGTVAYKNKKTVKNLVTNGKTVKLYAVWKKK